MKIPTANIYWRDVPRGSKVELVRSSYAVTRPDGSRAVAYWEGREAVSAQRALDRMAGGKKGSRY